MRRLALLLVPAAMFGGAARYARLGDFEGKVEVQLQAPDAWTLAQRNLPLPESAWLRTAADGKVEIELDDGGAFRLGPASLAEISDQSRLSTGQRITLLSLDSGIGYFTGQPEGKDALILAIPGAQVTLLRGARIRLEAASEWSQVAVIEGRVRFSSSAAEFDLTEGQTARVEPSNPARFFLYRDVAPLALDRWNERRDKVLAVASSGRHVPVGYGLADLDANGEWIQSGELGAVWKPKAAAGWLPYRDGHWQWYDALGYTWIAGETWGWAPYHYGRWLRSDTLGWVWVPGQRAVFKPGEVYWLRGARIAGWGPLAPGEEWTPKTPPLQFLNVHTTWATFQQDAHTIDPAGFSARPKEALGAAAFALALPSPALPAARLDAVRPVLRVGATRVTPVVPGAAYSSGSDAIAMSVPEGAPQADDQVAEVTNAGSGEAPVAVGDQSPPPPPLPTDVIYPVPVYTGIVIVNPPERGDYSRRRGNSGSGSSGSGSSGSGSGTSGNQQSQTPSSAAAWPRIDAKRDGSRRSVSSVPSATTSAQPVTRSEPVREHKERTVATPSTPSVAAPAVRSEPSHQHKERPPDPPAGKTTDAPVRATGKSS
jgi:hypothetical protein